MCENTCLTETGYLVGDANGIEGESVQHIIEESDFQKWKGELSDAKLACSPGTKSICAVTIA